MKQLFSVGIFFFGVTFLFSTLAGAAEEDVLQALESVRSAVEDEVPYEKVAELLDGAKIQVNAIKKGDTTDCFRAAVKRSYYWYRLGVKSWEMLMKNQEERDIHVKRAKSEYSDEHMKTISLKMAEGYDKLVTHAREALPSKWEYGNCALDEAQACQRE